MKQILSNFGLILTMETIETQTTSQINFDKYEVSGEIYRVKKNFENM